MELSIDDVIEALGGLEGAAELTESSPQSVRNWRFNKRIPPKFYLVVTEELKRKSIQAPLHIFRMKAP